MKLTPVKRSTLFYIIRIAFLIEAQSPYFILSPEITLYLTIYDFTKYSFKSS